MTTTFKPESLVFALVGDESLTIACGDMLLTGGHRIARVITRDGTVRDWALTNDLSVSDSPDELIAEGQGAPVDWLLSIANLRVLPDNVLRAARFGAVNFHDGPLPERAGLNTPAWAILEGATDHGVTWHLMEGGVDEGDILYRAEVSIDFHEIALTLNAKCYAAGLESFGQVLAQMERGKLNRKPQDLSHRRYFAGQDRPESLGLISGKASVAEVCRLVRGLDFGGRWNPLTTPKIQLGDKVFVVGAAEPADGNGPAGEVLAVTGESVTLACADGAVRLSGLTDPAGLRVDAARQFSEGVMVSGESDLDEQALRLLNKAEPHWRSALTQYDPLPIPLATSGAVGGPRETLRLTLPDGAKPAQTVAAAALTILRGAGRTSGDIGLHCSRQSPLLSDWVPLKLTAEADTPVKDVTDAVVAAIDKSATGFAVDLSARDPAITSMTVPSFAISLSGSDLAGALLCLSMSDDGGVLHYDTERLTPEVAALLGGRIEAACAAMVADDSPTCSTIWTLPDAERTTVLDAWNDTAQPFDAKLTIHAAFEAQAARAPDATAVVFEGLSLTYAELDVRANRIAHVLREMGAGPGTPVGLCCARGLDLVAGALGILKAGAAYVPLDPAYPADRLAHFMRDSGAPILLLQDALRDRAPESDAETLAIDTDPRIAAAPATPVAAKGDADDLAYLIYTSGSTGTPKGVMVSHANVSNFFTGMDARIDHEAGAVWLSVTSLSFDISVLELFWTLARGFKVVVAGDPTRAMFADPKPSTSKNGSKRRLDFNLFYWGNDDGVGLKKYELLLEGAKFADAHGFNAVWTPERHFHAFGGPYPNPSVTGAAVAAVTRNLAVRAGSCVAPLHHPARIAEEWAVIDNLTNGRVGLAIASGWQPDDFVLRPENTPPENKPAMYAAIQQLRALWSGEAVEFPRADGSSLPVITQPRPVSKKLPIWVTTAGNPQTWKEAGEIGANVLTHLLGQSVEEVAEKIAIYDDALRDAGHDPDDHRVTVMLHSYLAETREAARDVAREPMKDYLRSAAGLIKQYAWAFPAFKKPAEAGSAFDFDLESLSEEEMDAILEFAFERYFNDSGMFGTVEDGLARAEELRAIGVDEIACLIDYGIAPEIVLEGLKSLAEVLARANETPVEAAEDYSIAAQIARHGVTHLQCTPSMAQMLLMEDRTADALAGISHVMLGGEALPGSLVTTLRKVTGATIQNMYGPTETTIWSTTQMLDGEVADTAAIGTPIANTQIYVLDDARRPMPTGAPGELWIGGAGVTQGYWQRDALTAERFCPNPFAQGRMYRTGDLVCRAADGTLRYLGRADDQVKIRGHRIELGEIESRLAALPGVRQAVVTAIETQSGQQLVGYVTADRELDSVEAKTQLAKHLPDIMVPAHVVTLAEMPLTPNRKIDRKALPAPERPKPALEPAKFERPVRRVETTRDAAPVTKARATEAISAVWEALLGVRQPAADDNFFALGGHSLLAVQAHRDIKAALGADSLSITDIFRFPTLGALADHLGAATSAPMERKSSPLSTPIHRPALQRLKTRAVDPDTAEVISRRRQMRARRERSSV